MIGREGILRPVSPRIIRRPRLRLFACKLNDMECGSVLDTVLSTIDAFV